MVKALVAKPKGWPVQMQEAVSASGEITDVLTGSHKGSVGATVAQTAKPAASSSGKPGTPSWLHGDDLTKEAASDMLSVATDGELTSGTFLVRKRYGKPGFVLSVCYKQQATHHLITRSSKTEPFSVGKNVVPGATSLKKLVSALRTKKPFWPVPLTTAVNRDDAGSTALEKPEPVSSSTKAKKQSPGSKPAPSAKHSASTGAGEAPWLHGMIGKEAASEILNAGEPEPRDGRFLVRRHKTPGHFVLTVGYKGSATHHKVHSRSRTPH